VNNLGQVVNLLSCGLQRVHCRCGTIVCHV